jgi:hypothetical protein
MAGGFGLLAYLLLPAPGWGGWMIVASGFAGIFGAYWLYEDFINATPNDGKQ